MTKPNILKYEGRIESGKVSIGSKSERETVFLVTSDRTFNLRRHGANPFVDKVLSDLVGKDISCEGMLTSTGILIITNWIVL